MRRRSHLDPPAMLALLLLCALWGVGQVAVKVGNTGISPMLQAGLRSCGAALLLGAWSAGRRVAVRTGPPEFWYAAVIAVTFTLEFVCIYWGLVFTTVARATLFLYMSPFAVALGAHWLLPGERLHAWKVAGLLCAFAGLTIAFADGLRLPSARGLVGDAMELGGALAWAGNTLLVKWRGPRASPNQTLFAQLAGSALLLIALSFASGESGITHATPLVVGALAYQIVIVAFASYLAWFELLARYPASELSAFSFWTPLFGVAASAVLLGERITPAIAVAVVLVAAGIYLVNRPG